MKNWLNDRYNNVSNSYSLLMHVCTHILYPTLLFVAQSKNTHSTDNKNVKPLKANVPKVLHDNFEQPRKIRPQVTN